MPQQRYRDLVAPTRVQTGLPDSGGTDLAGQLARAAKGVQDLATNVGSALAAQRGAAEGQKAGLSGSPKPREGLSALSPFGREYNSAAEAAYSVKVQTDIQDSLERLAMEHQADPAGFQHAANSFAAAIHDSVPESYRPWVGQLLKGKIQVGSTRLLAQQRVREGNRIVADYLEGVNSAAQMAIEGAVNLPGGEGDTYVTGFVTENRRRLDAMEAEGLIDATDVVKYDDAFRTAIDKGLTAAPVNAAVEKINMLLDEDVEAGVAAWQLAESNPNLTDEQKADIGLKVRGKLTDLNAMRSRLYAEDKALLGKRLAAEESGPGVEREARRLYRLGAMTEDEFSAALATSVRNAKTTAEKTTDVVNVQEALRTGARLNPGDSKVRKQVDTYFGAYLAHNGIEPGSAQAYAVATSLFEQTNVFPPSAKSSMEIALMSPDPLDAALAAGVYENARKSNPYAWAIYGDSPALQSRASQINQGLAGKMTPESAVNLADKNINTPEPVRKLLEARFAKEKVPDRNLSMLKDELRKGAYEKQFDTEFFAGPPDPPLELQAEYATAVQTFYMLNGGNEQQARQQAADTVLPLYRRTRINGKPEIVKHGIPEGQEEIVRQDVDSVLDAVGYTGDKTKVKVVPNILTDQSVNGNLPGMFWSLVPVDDNGNVFDVVRGPDNLPVLYNAPAPKSPTWQAAEEAKRKAALADAEQRLKNLRRAEDLMNNQPLVTLAP